MNPPCPTCGRVHATGEVVALDRFSDAPPRHWVRKGGGMVRNSRAEAQLDVCPGWVETG